jgi:transcription initiation factor TFIIH subunit 2
VHVVRFIKKLKYSKSLLTYYEKSHLETSDNRFSTGGYFCPICNNKYCELPVECKVCGLTLVIAPHLARSYHHLFPLEPYKEVSNEGIDSKPLYE